MDLYRCVLEIKSVAKTRQYAVHLDGARAEKSLVGLLGFVSKKNFESGPFLRVTYNGDDAAQGGGTSLGADLLSVLHVPGPLPGCVKYAC